MSIKKRGDIWWIDITTPSGERIRRSTGTTLKRDAQEYHDKLKAELWAISKLGENPSRLFEEAVVEFLKDGQNNKTFTIKQMHAKYWLNVFSGRDLACITGLEVSNALPSQNTTTKNPVSNATKNRYRASINRMFNLALKNGWIDKVPYIQSYQEPKVRVKWATKEQAQALISHLSLNWMKDVCTFALLTGARMSEILTLTWEEVNFKQKIAVVKADKAKNGRTRSLPLNSETIALLFSRDKKSHYVFARETKKRVFDIDRRDFKQACIKAGLIEFHFHDLRHTWASWHVQAGTPLFTLKELGGWETLEMVKKYAHLDISHLSAFSNHVTFTAQSPCKVSVM